MSTINNQVNPYPFEPTKPYSESAMRHYDNLPLLAKKRIDRDRNRSTSDAVDALYLDALHQAFAKADDLYQRRDEAFEQGGYGV